MLDIRSNRGLSETDFAATLAARQASKPAPSVTLPPELFQITRSDFGGRDNGLDWRGCPDMPRSAKTLVS
jgi:hypothetical protein